MKIFMGNPCGCGNCEHYRPNSNICPNHGICKEYEALVNYTQNACGWYCKRNGGRQFK